MQVAALDNSFNYEAWLAVNTDFCQRHRCRLTVADCDLQRRNSQGEFGDLRCQGCGGLENQPEVIDEIGEYGKTTPRLLTLVTSPVSDDPFAVALLSILNEKSVCSEVDAVEEKHEYDNACIDESDLDDEVMRLFPELREFIEEIEPVNVGSEDRRGRTVAEGTHIRNKYSVYMGRCERCRGYMDNTRESHLDEKYDDDVYRCLACGWRTSPAYAWNRKNPHLAGWRG